MSGKYSLLFWTAAAGLVFCLESVVRAGNLNPSAPPAGTMKPLDQIEPRTPVDLLPGNASSTYVISQSGSYYLTGNLFGTLGHHVIEITADNVTLDLCGFTVTGAIVMIGQTRHGIYMSGRTNVEIRNGTIQACSGHGLCELGDGRGHRVLSVRSKGNSLHGIYLKGSGHLVKDCTAIDNKGPGIHAGFPSTVKDNHQSANGDNMLLVKAGLFAYQNAANMEDWVYLPDFYIAKIETTNSEYCRFLNEMDPEGQYFDSHMEITQSGSAGQYTYTVQSGKESHPIRYVSVYDAQAYANWKSRVTGLNYRLPTEQEWEKAAGWDPILQKLWTYGFQKDTIDATWCNYSNYYGGTLPVGSFNGTGGKNDAYSYYGCYDMSGNVWEWTVSPVDSNPGSRIVRGSSWYHSDYYCNVTKRGTTSSWYRVETLGFRLVRDLN
jgi:formylglycine-generating enzyme required for sulfatase activity